MSPSTSPLVLSPRAVEAIYDAGHWLYSQGRFGHAATVFRAMVYLAVHDERGWLALGACHEQQDQADIALELYTAASSMACAAPRCELARARLLRSRGRQDEATRALAAAARIADERRDEDLRRLIAVERSRV
jgi:Tfp pilus assembly protein PilF